MSVVPSVGRMVGNLFFLRPTRSDLCRVYGLVYSLTSEKRTGRRIDGSTDRRIDGLTDILYSSFIANSKCAGAEQE